MRFGTVDQFGDDCEDEIYMLIEDFGWDNLLADAEHRSLTGDIEGGVDFRLHDPDRT